MTNILIPTDFTPASLKFAEQALQNMSDQKVNITLFHAFELPSSSHDLFGNGVNDPQVSLTKEPFRLACKQLKDRYSKSIGKIMVRCMNGDTIALFRNFTDANDIDLIYCPANYVYTKIHQRSIDPIPYFKKCGLPFHREFAKRTEPIFINQSIVQAGLSAG